MNGDGCAIHVPMCFRNELWSLPPCTPFECTIVLRWFFAFRPVEIVDEGFTSLTSARFNAHCRIRLFDDQSYRPRISWRLRRRASFRIQRPGSAEVGFMFRDLSDRRRQQSEHRDGDAEDKREWPCKARTLNLPVGSIRQTKTLFRPPPSNPVHPEDYSSIRARLARRGKAMWSRSCSASGCGPASCRPDGTRLRCVVRSMLNTSPTDLKSVN